MRDEEIGRSIFRRYSSRSFLIAGVMILALVLTAFAFRKTSSAEEKSANELDSIAIAVQESRNRLEVSSLRGTVTTVRHVNGGLGGVLHGEMKAVQPFSVAYHVDMNELGLRDFIWDRRTRTLLVRAPEVRADPPNIDERGAKVTYRGPIITRKMQTALRKSIAEGASRQASEAAASPDKMAKAKQAARSAIERNFRTPLSAAGIRDFRVSVSFESGRENDERWDVSRSIEEVLAERAR